MDGAKPLLHLWSEQLNLTRRVLAITDHSEQRLALAVERFGRSKPDRLEFIRREFERGARQVSHQQFRDRLAQLLAEQYPDETVESLVASPDLEHSLSGDYARGILRRGSSYVAVLAVPGEESSDVADNSLTFALLWLRRVRESNCRGAVTGLRIILPKNACGTVAHRLAALDPRLAVAIIELKASEHIHLPLQAADYWLRVRRQLQSGEIPRYGYFQGVALQQASPLVYLVAPALRFHPTTDDLLNCLSPEMEIVRVGFAESWRRGLHVVMRQ